MRNYIKKIAKKTIPPFILNKIRYVMYPKLLHERFLIAAQAKRHKKALKKLKAKVRDGEKIKVAFFVIHAEVWKLDGVFQTMLTDDVFEPVIVVCPYIVYGKEQMLIDMNRAFEYFTQKGYETVKTYNEQNDEWFDVKKKIKPDIVFFTNPYHGLTKDEYYIMNYLDTLTCYVPYSSMICSIPFQFDKPLQNLVWKFFLENSLIKEFTQKQSVNKGKNTEVSGSPIFDAFLVKNNEAKNVWKHNQSVKIIWAPHHTIDNDGPVRFSCFLKYADFMLETAKKYCKEVQIAFKPHPILYSKLILLWGKEKTDKYYAKWEFLENGQIEKGEYIDLFQTSDAMIFDSISFINEYLYLQKPSLFIYKSDIDEQLNKYGVKALSCHQKACGEQDVVKFIDSIIVNADDPKKEEKHSFFNSFLLPPNNRSASGNIVSDIRKAIF